MIKSNSPVQFHFLSRCNLNNRRSLKSFIARVFKKEGQALEGLDVIFCDDDYLLNLNKQFLKHDFYTDILSFPLSGRGLPLVAEIYISVDRVRENARNLNISFQKEIHRVILHGVLHFCGYRDKSASDIREMRSKEDKYLVDYFMLNAKRS